MEAWDDLVLVGIIARPHGHRGEVIVNPETDFPEQRFAVGAVLWMVRDGRPEPVGVRASRMHQGRPVVLLDAVASMNDAERLRGVELRVPERVLVPLPDGAYYRHQLVGCEVVTVAGANVGAVGAVEGDAGGQRLVVRSDTGEVLIPLAGPICRSIDVGARRIVVDLPEGLIELNASAPGRR